MNSLVPSFYLVNHYILNSLPTSNVTSVSLAEQARGMNCPIPGAVSWASSREGIIYVCAGLAPPALLRYFARPRCLQDYSTARYNTAR